MKPNKLFDLLYQALAETFEGMIFAEVIRGQSEETPKNNDEVYWARLEVLKPLKGKLTLILPEDLARQTVEDLYGFENTPPVEATQDMTGEIINTITGRLLNNLSPKDKSFEVGIPEKGKGELPPSENGSVREYYTINDRVISIIVEGQELLSYILHLFCRLKMKL